MNDSIIDDASVTSSRRNGIQVIARAAAILRLLESAQDGLSLGQIATRAGLARSTVQRIVAALEVEGLVMPAGPAGGVRLGPAVLRMAKAADIDVAKVAHPYLCELSKSINETVDLSMLVGDRAFFVDQVVSANQLKAEFTIGETLPLHCSAHGKALLAKVEGGRAQALVEGELGDDTARIDALMAELEEVRRTGFSYDMEQHVAGICVIGSAVSDGAGNLAAVSIPVPCLRFEAQQDRLLEELRSYCGKIQTALGSL